MTDSDFPVVTLPLAQFVRDAGTQSRVRISAEVVADYAAAMTAGALFPPVDVVQTGEDCYVLVDGFHRLQAAEQAGIAAFPARVLPGTLDDAIFSSAAANKIHGLRRTNDDKRNAIRVVLSTARGRALSNRAVADHVGVDHKTVGDVRGEMTQRGEIPHETRALVTRRVNIADDLRPEYPAGVSSDSDVEAARQIALAVVACYGDRGALDHALHRGAFGNDSRAVWRLGKGEIPMLDGQDMPVHADQVAVRIATVNGAGIYRFKARDLWAWADQRMALLQRGDVMVALGAFYYGGYADWSLSKQLETYGLTAGRWLTPDGRAALDAHIAASPLLTAEREIAASLAFKPALRDLERALRYIYDRQKRSGAYVPLSSHAGGEHLRWVAPAAARGWLLPAVTRPRVSEYSWEREQAVTFAAFTAAGAALLGLPPLPEPPLPDDLPYHAEAGTFVPPDARHTLAVGDSVRVSGTAKKGRVKALGHWPRVEVKYPDDPYAKTAYDNKLVRIILDDDPDPVLLKELEVAAKRVGHAIYELYGALVGWASDEADSPEDLNLNTQYRAKRLLYDLSVLVSRTKSARRAGVQPIALPPLPGNPDAPLPIMGPGGAGDCDDAADVLDAVASHVVDVDSERLQ